MILGGVSCRTPSKVIKLPTVEDVVCSCGFVSFSCDYEELAFSLDNLTEGNETDTYRNDFKSILITLLDDSSSYEFSLVSSDGTETILTDAYGTLFDKGFNVSQPLKVGFRIDWFKVFNLLGGDVYNIRIKQTDFGTEIVTDSHNIKLIVAEFGNESQQTEVSRLKDANYKDFDIQNEYYYQYNLSTNLLPSEIADFILNNDIKTDEIFISNYDVYAYRQYRDLEVIAEGTTEPSEDYVRNKNKKFNITFNDKTKNLKRNFN